MPTININDGFCRREVIVSTVACLRVTIESAMPMQYRPISLLRKIVRDDIVASPAGCAKRFVLG